MSFWVDWQPSAEQKLADIWTSATDRAAVTAAADFIDTELERDPLAAGESREDNFRIFIVQPLAVSFDVNDKDRYVTVWAVWRIR